jgi:hypothetical protein
MMSRLAVAENYPPATFAARTDVGKRGGVVLALPLVS